MRVPEREGEVTWVSRSGRTSRTATTWGGDDTGWAVNDLTYSDSDSIYDLALPWLIAAKRALEADESGDAAGDLRDFIEQELERTRPDHEKFRVLTYQHYDFARYALVARDSVIEYGHGDPARVIFPDELAATANVNRWNSALRSVLTQLTLRPAQEHGRWLLMSYWS